MITKFRTLGPNSYGDKISTIKGRFQTPSVRSRQIVVSTNQKLFFELGFRPKRAACKTDNAWFHSL